MACVMVCLAALYGKLTGWLVHCLLLRTRQPLLLLTWRLLLQQLPGRVALCQHLLLRIVERNKRLGVDFAVGPDRVQANG